MRPIKFRAWDKYSEVMYQNVVNGIYCDPDEILGFDQILGLAQYEVMQYTGLSDKNDREIYEGDVIDGSYVSLLSKERIEKLYKVVYANSGFTAHMIGSHPFGSTWLRFVNEEGEVIGNIYENPELLEGDSIG